MSENTTKSDQREHDEVGPPETWRERSSGGSGRRRPGPSSRRTSTRSGSEKRRTPVKETRSPRPVAGSRWWRSTPTIEVVGPDGPVTLLDIFEGRRQLIAYYHMWYAGKPAPEQCEGCTLLTTARSASWPILHSRDVTYATFCQGPFEESVRYRDFMGWDVPWYSVQESLEALLAGRQVNRFCLVGYLRQGDRVFETYWTNGRGVEAMDNSYGLLDMTVYGRQETWEDSPAGWPPSSRRRVPCTNGRPIPQWSRLEPDAPTTSGTTLHDDGGACWVLGALGGLAVRTRSPLLAKSRPAREWSTSGGVFSSVSYPSSPKRI